MTIADSADTSGEPAEPSIEADVNKVDQNEPEANDAASRGAPMTYPEEENDELEQEMLAAFEDGDYDEKAEEDIAAENG